MNAHEALDLIDLIRGYNPSFPIAEQTPAVWAAALADVPVADATGAVHAHFAVAGPWISVADIRRRVVAARGLLPPDTEAAYTQARRMNDWLNRRIGPEPATHPAVYATMAKHQGGIGWEILDGLEGYAHKRFVEAYAPISTRAAERALTTPLPALESAVHAPKALPGGSGVEAAEREAQSAERIDRPRAEAVKAQIAKANIGRLPDPPKRDYSAPSDLEKRRWSDAFREYATRNNLGDIDIAVGSA